MMGSFIGYSDISILNPTNQIFSKKYEKRPSLNWGQENNGIGIR